MARSQRKIERKRGRKKAAALLLLALPSASRVSPRGSNTRIAGLCLVYTSISCFSAKPSRTPPPPPPFQPPLSCPYFHRSKPLLGGKARVGKGRRRANERTVSPKSSTVDSAGFGLESAKAGKREKVSTRRRSRLATKD